MLPSWLGALRAHGLDRLSPPEMDGALQELTLERQQFVGMLAHAADWPRSSTVGVRVWDEREVRRLARGTLCPRALALPEDHAAVLSAAVVFRSVFVLDPFWGVRDLLHDAWHRPGGLSAVHAARLLRMAAPAGRLAPLVERRVVRFAPNALPGSWEPWPMGLDTPAGAKGEPKGLFALHAAARLLLWSTRLGAVAVCTLPAVSHLLRDLAGMGADGQGLAEEVEVALARPAATDEALRWRRVTTTPRGWRSTQIGYRRASRPDAPTADLLRRVLMQRAIPRAAALSTGPWRLGIGAPALPSVSLALQRASLGEPLRTPPAGTPAVLETRPVYLVTDEFQVSSAQLQVPSCKFEV